MLCVGNIYKNLRDMTSAAGLFKNSTLEQIPAKPMFANNTKITTFESCFENTNITTLPANFFTTNVNAVEFYLCAAGGYNRQVGLIEFPHDRQLGDNMAASDEIVKIIKKRIRKST